jgi:serine/threonine protein kinase
MSADEGNPLRFGPPEEHVFGVLDTYWESLQSGGCSDDPEQWFRSHFSDEDPHLLGDLHFLRAVHETCKTINDDTHIGPLSDESRRFLQPGEILDNRYSIIDLLGYGGMGEVYLAWHEQMNCLRAIKVLPENSANPSGVSRFQSEIQLQAQISSHRNIVAAMDAGDDRGRLYLVMEYVPGSDLKRYVQEKGPLSHKEACRFIRQAALGLEHAHGHGLVHRDVKPSNLMITRDGTIKILDLGLARLVSEEARAVDLSLTQSGVLLGTRDYTSPEQAKDPRQADERSDLYSLGCTFYYLLTGRPPFGDHLPTGKIVAHASEDPRPIRSLRPDVPLPVAEVVHKLLAKRPADRYRSASALIRAIDDSTRTRRWLWWIVGAATIMVMVIALLLILAPDMRPWGMRQGRDTTSAEGSNFSEKNLPLLALYWHGFVQAERNGEDELTLKDGMTLFNREQYRLVLNPSEDCYLYVIGVDRNGPTLWFPHQQIQLSNQCRANTEYQIPDGNNWYTLDDQTGSETIYLLASHERLHELEHLLKKGTEGNEQETAARIAGLVEALENKSANELQTRGQTIQPDQRIAKAQLTSGKEARQVMEVNLGAGYVVKRIRFEHKAPQP